MMLYPQHLVVNMGWEMHRPALGFSGYRHWGTGEDV